MLRKDTIFSSNGEFTPPTLTPIERLIKMSFAGLVHTLQRKIRHRFILGFVLIYLYLSESVCLSAEQCEPIISLVRVKEN